MELLSSILLQTFRVAIKELKLSGGQKNRDDPESCQNSIIPPG